MEINGSNNNNESSKARKALVHAATTLFAEHGFNATRVQQITDAAGINKAMLYYYFKNKDELYDSIINEGISTFDITLASAENDGPDIRDRLRHLLTTYLSVAAEKPELARVVFREAVGAGDAVRRNVAEHFTLSVKRLAYLLENAQREGDLRDDIDPNLSAYTLFGMANMYITRVVVNRLTLDVAALVEHILDIFFDGAGRAPNSSKEQES